MGATGALVRQHLRENRLSLLLWAAASALAEFAVASTAEVVGRGAFPWGAVLAGLAATGLLVGWSSRVFGRMRVAA